MQNYDADDLFAGPGGWDVGAASLGLTTLGYELDPNACATRRAAGLPTVEGDVRAADPKASTAPGLIASPPCQTFSMAGKGAGRAALDRLANALRTDWWYGQEGDDERTILVLEPYRWIYQRHEVGRPYGWIAFEQVATVLPIWEVYAEWLRDLGYSVATGVLNSEQYGVPQTRRRAVLVARLRGEAKLPTPTHSRYYSRTPDKLDPGVLPWVSMAEALGWGMTARPGFSVTVGTAAGGADPACVGGSGARRLLHGERDAGRWVFESNYSASGEPAFALTSKGPRWVRERPATTVNGDPRISAPGRHDPTVSGSQQKDAIKVSLKEAATLQTFAAGYPWQGSKTAQFQQVGNAVPPLLARAILAALVPSRAEAAA